MTDHVLAGDLSLSSTGAATITNDQRVTTFVKTTEPLPCHQGHRPCPDRHHPAVADVDRRLSDIARWFVGLMTVTTKLVVLEGPILGMHGGAQLPSQHERAGLFWRVVRGARAHELPVAVLNPTTLKGYICGKGNASKAEVQRAVAAAWPGQGLGRITKDEADAVAAATCAVDWLGWPGPWLDGRRGSGWLRNAQWPDRDTVTA